MREHETVRFLYLKSGKTILTKQPPDLVLPIVSLMISLLAESQKMICLEINNPSIESFQKEVNMDDAQIAEKQESMESKNKDDK